MNNVIIVRYGELFLKSEPVLKKFEKTLIENIKIGLKKEKIKFKILRKRGRIFVETSQIKRSSSVLKRIFGVVSFSPCFNIKSSEIKKIQIFVKKNYKKWIGKNQKFAVRAKRVGRHSYTSQKLAKLIGDVVDRKVDLSNPDVEIFIEVRDNDSYIYTKVIKGPGGMPLGTSGKVVCLVSGGIDSAVASWLMMKRGCTIIPLFASKSKSRKVFLDVIKELKKWHLGKNMRIFIFDQRKNLDKFNKKAYRYTCILCKRMMYKVANGLAKKMNAKAIVTGESLAQVASQTLDNLMVLDQASELPIFRPLIGLDKTESIDIAKRIGTYEKSIEDKKICWAVPKKPKTKAKLEEVLKIEDELKIEKIMKESFKTLREVSV